MRESTAPKYAIQNGHVLVTATNGETDSTDGDRHKAEIRDLDAHALSVSLGNNPDNRDAKLNAVAADSSPSIDDSQPSTENTKNQTGDSSYERQMFHSGKPPNV